MKIRLWKAVLTSTIALLAISGAARAQNDNSCSDATLRGDYAFTIAGEVLNPDGTITKRNGVAMTHFDGTGNLAQIDYVASLTPGHVPPGGIDLTPAFRLGETGTYHVTEDCTGTAEIDFPPPPGFAAGAVIKLIFVVSDHGRAIHTVVTSLTPPGELETADPLPVVIHSDGWKLGRPTS